MNDRTRHGWLNPRPRLRALRRRPVVPRNLDAEALFRSAFELAPIGVGLVEVNAEGTGRFVRVNDALCTFTGYPADELLRMAQSSIIHPDDVDAHDAAEATLLSGAAPAVDLELRYLHRDGSILWALANTSLVRDATGEPRHAIAQIVDISERKRFEGQLQHLADHDVVTGLFNRRRFEDELNRETQRVKRYGKAGAVLVLDLDHFKYVNDTLGHAVGDELIARVGCVLRDRLRITDVVGRLGGDEFGLLLPECSEEEAVALARELIERIRREAVIVHGDQAMRLTASIGLARLDPHTPSGDAALVGADIAMYEAKQSGRNRIAVASESDGDAEAHMQAGLTWSERIRRALEEDRFELHAQPILDLRTGVVTRHELLLRMISDTGELIPPGTFLYVAERFGLIQEIDAWVIRHAIALIHRETTAGRTINLEVNLSGVSITEDAIAELIEKELAATPVPPGSLTFEVTETAAIVNIQKAKSFAARLSELGCSFALDDFGSGFGSFYYLKHLPFDLLKIDGDFVRDLTKSPPDQLTVKAIVEIARGLGKETIAEFVEDEETLRLLTRMGVDYAQGYHVGRPVSNVVTWPDVGSEQPDARRTRVAR